MENNIIDGVVVVNKPTGMNSMTCVKKVQRKLGAAKAGHLGTLDPFATGVLLVALGKGTKLFDAHLKDKKTYKAIFKFGIETDTFDSEGLIAKQDDKVVCLDELKEVCQKLVGTQNQMPPAYSAKKIGGKKAYEFARQNIEVVLKPKEITIFSLDVLQQLDKNTFLLETEVSSGTYIRSIVRDLAALLGTCGTMVGLIRTVCGQHKLEESVTLDELTLKNVKSLN